MASMLTFEPKPFTPIEKLLRAEMVQVNKTIIQGSGSIEEKARVMRDYVMKVIDHYTRKVTRSISRTRRWT